MSNGIATKPATITELSPADVLALTESIKKGAAKKSHSRKKPAAHTMKDPGNKADASKAKEADKLDKENRAIGAAILRGRASLALASEAKRSAVVAACNARVASVEIKGGDLGQATVLAKASAARVEKAAKSLWEVW